MSRNDRTVGCFACGADLSYHLLGMVSSAACKDCIRKAVLVQSGASLTSIIHGGRKYPLEGSLLSVIVNPVEINGRRAWVDFGGGGYAVFEEIHPSADWFDFCVQHSREYRPILDNWEAWCDPGEDALIFLVGLDKKLATPTKPKGLLGWFRRRPRRAFGVGDQLSVWFGDCIGGQRILSEVGPIQDHQQASAAAERLSKDRSPVAEGPRELATLIVERLANLAVAA